MLILFLEEQKYHTQQLTMDLGNRILELINMDKYNPIQWKTGSYTRK